MFNWVFFKGRFFRFGVIGGFYYIVDGGVGMEFVRFNLFVDKEIMFIVVE